MKVFPNSTVDFIDEPCLNGNGFDYDYGTSSGTGWGDGLDINKAGDGGSLFKYDNPTRGYFFALIQYWL